MHSYTVMFRPYLFQLAEQYRMKQRYTQERMAACLHMTARNYNRTHRLDCGERNRRREIVVGQNAVVDAV